MHKNCPPKIWLPLITFGSKHMLFCCKFISCCHIFFLSKCLGAIGGNGGLAFKMYHIKLLSVCWYKLSLKCNLKLEVTYEEQFFFFIERKRNKKHITNIRYKEISPLSLSHGKVEGELVGHWNWNINLKNFIRFLLNSSPQKLCRGQHYEVDRNSKKPSSQQMSH